MDQAAQNNRAIEDPWYVGDPDKVFTKKDIRRHYTSLNRVGTDSVYGTVYKINRKQAKDFMTMVDRSKYRDAQTRYITTNDKYMALKIIHKRKGISWEEFSLIVQREANIQMMVHRKHPKITPPVLVAGMYHDHGTGYIMSPWVSNLKPLADNYKGNMYPAVESMFRKVWSLGILHMDAHLNNIFITPKDTLMLLDWGAAAFVPAPLVEDLRQRVSQTNTNLFDVWKSFVTDHADQKVEERLYNQVKYRAGAPNLRKKNADWLILKSLKPKNKKTNQPQESRAATINTTTKQRSSNSRSGGGLRQIVAKGGGVKMRKFPYPNSAWSRLLFEPSSRRESRKKNTTTKYGTNNTKSNQKKEQSKNSTTNVTQSPPIKMVKSNRSR